MADQDLVPLWRELVQRFPCLVKKLPEDFEPSDLIFILKEFPLSMTERDLAQFLLHVWNRYEYPFALEQLLCWDEPYRQAFLDWFTGRLLGQPSRYF